MADSDPISDGTPAGKKRRLNGGSIAKEWDPENDSGDDLFENHETIATIPLKRFAPGSTQRSQNAAKINSSQQYGNFSDIDFSYSSQPTQLPTQFTQQRTQAAKPISPAQDIQVERSSPPALPPPISRSAVSRPSSLLASSIAPRGTAYRKPAIPAKKEIVDVDSDASDPPVEHSSDDESRMVPALKPTAFVRQGQQVGSSSSQVVQDSPRNAQPNSFKELLGRFKHDKNVQSGDSMANAYGSVSRGPRPIAPRPQPITPKARPQNAASWAASPIQTMDDISDFSVQNKVRRIMNVLGENMPIAQIYDALKRKHMNQDDAIEFLSNLQQDSVNADIDDLAPTPIKQNVKGMAHAVQSSQVKYQPNKPAARQEVKAPVRSIHEKYATQARKPSQSQAVPESQDDVVQHKGRLLKGRRPQRSPSPEEVIPHRPAKKSVITIDDDSDEDVHEETEDEKPTESTFSQRLLELFNNGTLQELVELSTRPEEELQVIIGQRPFRNLDQVRNVSNAGSKSRKRAIGEKIVDSCEQMLAGYEAVDELVTQCGEIAKPIQEALKSWGIKGEKDGELHVMKLHDHDDSGIGTPSSSPENGPTDGKRRVKKFLRQPSNMSSNITMKDYQLVGLNWLHLLYKRRISCILADDMGLGKTCQIISFLAQLQVENTDSVNLVIVPGSTLENWLRELKNFAPSLTVFPYYGGHLERPGLQKEIEDRFSELDVIVTTYDMAVKDWKFLRSVEPGVLVYDEAHALRNPDSDRYDKLIKIKADFKVLLTGTPLQNNLKELIAILAFIMPRLFKEKKEDLEFIFKHKATTKDTDGAALLAAERIQRARSMITPFILRRKKAQVLDLPAKHSRVEYCDMTDEQLEIYDNTRAEAQQMFEDRWNGKKAAAKQSSNVLMSLRKAAIHPLLERRIYNDKKIDKIVTLLAKNEEFSGNPPDKIRKYLTGEAAQSLNGNDFSLHQFCEERPYLHKFMLKNEEWMDSGKVKKFEELIKEFARKKDKVLVFSQFTMLMDILEAVLQTMNVKFMRLDGSTKMDTRQDMIDQFNEEGEITVFMLSTKAGGAGINLASANKVVIFDSGFNPQDDIQAENRAHRVGQIREVEVIRLVSRGTIEEQIHALGESKLELDSRVAGEGATAGDDKAAEKAGAAAVEKMLMESMVKKDDKDDVKQERKGSVKSDVDLKDAFKKGLQENGLHVA